MTTSVARLAIDGGQPVRSDPFPTTANASGRTLGKEEIDALRTVIESGQLSRVGGSQVPALESEFGALIGAEHVVASTSGTSAIHLAVSAVELEPGDEVIVPPITDFGTIVGVLAQNAVPIFADVDPISGCITADTVSRVLSERTRAIIVVHLFGGGAPVNDIVALARPRGITVIEDCAQAYLAVPPGGDTYAGTRADIGCFSLQQSKHVTSGDGGLTITDDPAIIRHMRLFSDKGWPRDTGERTHLFHGFNYRMTELQGAVARAQFGKLPGVIASRRRSAHRLAEQLSDLSGLTLPADIDRHSFWLLPLIVDFDNKRYGKALVAEGIPVSAGYLERPVYLVPALTERRVYGKSGFPFTAPPARREIVYAAGDCPAAEDMINRTLLVMQWNENYTAADVDDIAAAIRKVHKHLVG
jgi:dTDP-4-amino-4,6-dideoxygalactose transaminase